MQRTITQTLCDWCGEGHPTPATTQVTIDVCQRHAEESVGAGLGVANGRPGEQTTGPVLDPDRRRPPPYRPQVFQALPTSDEVLAYLVSVSNGKARPLRGRERIARHFNLTMGQAGRCLTALRREGRVQRSGGEDRRGFWEVVFPEREGAPD